MNSKDESIGLSGKPTSSYGIVEMPQPDDVLYKLTYDQRTSELKFGKHFVIKKFQWEEDGDLIFRELFYPDSPAARERNSGPVKEAELPSKERGYAIVNNIKIPLSLRKAFFRTSHNGKKIQVHTEITRERAELFHISPKEVDDYITSTRDKRSKS